MPQIRKLTPQEVDSLRATEERRTPRREHTPTSEAPAQASVAPAAAPTTPLMAAAKATNGTASSDALRERQAPHEQRPTIQRPRKPVRTAQPQREQPATRNNQFATPPREPTRPANVQRPTAAGTIPGAARPNGFNAAEQPPQAVRPAQPATPIVPPRPPQPPVGEPEADERLVLRLVPVQLRGDATRRGEQIHLTAGSETTLCGVAYSSETPAMPNLTYGVAWDCQRCAVLLHRLQAHCPSCGQPLRQVAADGRCTNCAQAERARARRQV